jgi:cobalt-precorrin-5B (C1)-methyltransferase
MVRRQTLRLTVIFNGAVFKYGITTGATAAAAAKAAVIAAFNEPVDRVVIPTPIGYVLRFQ